MIRRALIGCSAASVLASLLNTQSALIRTKNDSGIPAIAGPTLIVNTTFTGVDWDLRSWCKSGATPTLTDDAISGVGHAVSVGGGQCVDGRNLSAQGCPCTTSDSITAAANNPNGAGGKGFRNYVSDGQNTNGGGFNLSFGTERSEYWLRWYERWQAGFRWNGHGPQYEKMMYFDANDATNTFPRWAAEITATGGMIQVFPTSNTYGGSTRWTRIMAGSTSDGNFHCFEVHVKKDTNGRDGVFQAWVGNKLVADYSDIDWHRHGNTMTGPNNQNNPANGQIMYRDFDDIALAIAAPSGRIGC
jgi:hypothetical protein